MLKVGLVGFGGIARIHKRAYEAIMQEKDPNVKLVSIFDINASQFTKNISINIASDGGNDLSAYHLYDNLDEMLEKEQLDFLDVCVPTFLHCETVCNLLSKGYNVYSEKPMALSFEEADRMIAARNASGKHLLIGHLLRFTDINQYVKKMIDDKTYGKVIDAEFHRLSQPPRWNPWLLNADKSGGCILDMHMHDIDLARFFFGDPKAVSTHSVNVFTRFDTNHTTLIYDGFTAHAVGDWALSDNFPFQSGYRISLEKATIILDGDNLTVIPCEGESFTPETNNNDGVLGAIRYFSDMLENGKKNTLNSSRSSAQTIWLVSRMIESAENGGKQIDTADMPYKN